MKINNSDPKHIVTPSDTDTGMFSRLKQGDTIRVQVIDTTSDNLILRMSDGTFFKATSLVPFKMHKGCFMNLAVKNKTQNRLILQTVDSVKTFNDEKSINNELKEKNIEINKTNSKIAVELKSRNISVNRDFIKQTANILSRFRNIDIPRAILFAANDILPGQQKIKTLNDIVINGSRFSKKINNMLSLMTKPENNNILKKNDIDIDDKAGFFKDFHIELNNENKHNFNKENFFDYFKKIYFKLDLIKQIFVLNKGNESGIVNITQNLQNDIEFFNDLNNYNTYIQIPVNLNEQKTTVEMYILKRKSSNKNLSKNMLSVLISVSTANLGRVDSLITLNERNITISMRVEDDQIFKVLKSKHHELYSTLQKKGYKLTDFKYKILEKFMNPANYDEYIIKELNENKYNLDFRI